jgi:hypothetical protein
MKIVLMALTLLVIAAPAFADGQQQCWQMPDRTLRCFIGPPVEVIRPGDLPPITTRTTRCRMLHGDAAAKFCD